MGFKNYLTEMTITDFEQLIRSKGYDNVEKFGAKGLKVSVDGDRVEVLKSIAGSIKGAYYDTKATSGSSVGKVVVPGGFSIIAKPLRKAAADAKTTAMQERGSAWIIRRAIKDNMKYNSPADIRRDPKYSELVSLYPAVNEDDAWLSAYFAQQKKMLDEFSGAEFTEYNRDGGFMDYITKLVKTKFGISKKDTWNPADIWLVKNQQSVEARINKAVAGPSGTQSIQELNAILRSLFKSREVVGISLKKVSGKVARYEEYNVDGVTVDEDFRYSIKDMKCLLTVSDKSASFFTTQDAMITVGDAGQTYKFQIKANDSGKISNLKYEPIASGAAAARVGKAPVGMVDSLLVANNMNFKNDHKNFPKSAKQFEAVKATYTKIFNGLKKDPNVNIGTTTVEEFVDNVKRGLDSGNNKIFVTTLSKLMQMKFLAAFLKLSTEKREAFFTDMVFLSAKKGNSFGPFGKLY